jgi:hypothetical protein
MRDRWWPLMRWLFAVSLTACLSKPAPGGKAVESIGVASMSDDGTIKLQLRAQSDAGIGEALLVYPRSHPKYSEILKHLGGIEPGQQKPVPPWEE